MKALIAYYLLLFALITFSVLVYTYNAWFGWGFLLILVILFFYYIKNNERKK